VLLEPISPTDTVTLKPINNPLVEGYSTGDRCPIPFENDNDYWMVRTVDGHLDPIQSAFEVFTGLKAIATETTDAIEFKIE
jgi:hypothetical protein